MAGLRINASQTSLEEAEEEKIRYTYFTYDNIFDYVVWDWQDSKPDFVGVGMLIGGILSNSYVGLASPRKYGVGYRVRSKGIPSKDNCIMINIIYTMPKSKEHLELLLSYEESELE